MRLSAESCGLPVLRSRRERRAHVAKTSARSLGSQRHTTPGSSRDGRSTSLCRGAKRHRRGAAAQRCGNQRTYARARRQSRTASPSHSRHRRWSDRESCQLSSAGSKTARRSRLTPWLDVLGVNVGARPLRVRSRARTSRGGSSAPKNARVKPCNCDDIAVALVALLRRNRARDRAMLAVLVTSSERLTRGKPRFCGLVGRAHRRLVAARRRRVRPSGTGRDTAYRAVAALAIRSPRASSCSL